MAIPWLKALAVACLALAIGSIVASMRATLRAGEIQGPGALVVLPSGEVWLGVDDALWRLSAQGQLLDEQPIRATGLPGAAANLVRGPDGAIVASVRGDATLYFLDATGARVYRRLNPLWPADLQGHGARAINFAFDAAGRVAIATGGGDTVALFEGDGRFVARSAPATYQFTNGLWWSDEGLWTTDTNRFILRLLDATTLGERRAVELGEAAGGSFLGPARARPGAPAGAAPMAAMIRFRGDMTDGSLSWIGADARVVALPHGAGMEPRDLDWLGDTLLATDGLSFAVLRWSADRRALAPFGDAVVQQRLRARASERDALRRDYVRWLIAAGIALALGMLFAALVPWASRPAEPRRFLDLSQLGTPRLGWSDLLGLQLRLYSGLIAMAAPMVALALFIEIAPRDTLKAWLGNSLPLALLAVALATLVPLLLAISLIVPRFKQQSRLPVFEPVLNQRAMGQLKSHAQVVAHVLRDGERVLEAFNLAPGSILWVLTDERLLAFRRGLFDATAIAAHELGDVRSVSSASASTAPTPWWRRGAPDGARLEIAIEGRLPLAGAVGSPALATRLAQRIRELSAALRAQAPSRAPEQPGHIAELQARRRRRAIASALLPGLGQWQQRRAAEAIAFLAAWAALLIFGSVPMLWTLVEPFTGVRTIDVATVLLLHLLLSGAAAADAWQRETLVAG